MGHFDYFEVILWQLTNKKVLLFLRKRLWTQIHALLNPVHILTREPLWEVSQKFEKKNNQKI